MKTIRIIERLTGKDITAQVIATNGLFVKNGTLHVRMCGEDITYMVAFLVD